MKHKLLLIKLLMAAVDLYKAVSQNRSCTDLTKTSRKTTLLQQPTNTKDTAKTVFIFTQVKNKF